MEDQYTQHQGSGRYSGTGIDLVSNSRTDALPIRSDIEDLCKLSDAEFADWYSERKDVAEKLLAPWKLFASIPNTRYSSERQKLGMESNTHIKNTVRHLEEGLEQLEIIKEFRDRYRGFK